MEREKTGYLASGFYMLISVNVEIILKTQEVLF